MTKTNDKAAIAATSNQFQTATTPGTVKPANPPAQEIKRAPVNPDYRWDVC